MTLRSGNSGLLLALSGFALLSCGDAVIKSIAGAWPAPDIAALRFTLGAIGLGMLLYWKQGRASFAIPNPAVQLLRGSGIAFGTICFFSAINLMPLAEATAITFTSPMITALLATMILKEPAGRKTIIASIIAFLGVLLILRPNFSVLGLAALLPLGSAFGMAFVMIGNRIAASHGSPLQMQFLLAAVAAPILTAIAIAGNYVGGPALAIHVPHWPIVAKICVVAVSASTAHWLIYLGTTKSSAADIAPMSYVQLLVAMVLGMLIFGDFPDALSLIGSTIIIGAGLYLWHSKRPVARDIARI
jgi:drug/metabolite transporter (DMT)-like permease